MTDHLALLRVLDDVYRIAVTEPETWSEDAAARWATDALIEQPSRAVARHVRAVLRMSVKLAAFWREPPPGVPDDGDWTARVDVAFGARAWRPLLEVARTGLEAHPDAELFEEVKERFRVVHNQRWMEGVGYEEWQAEHAKRI